MRRDGVDIATTEAPGFRDPTAPMTPAVYDVVAVNAVGRSEPSVAVTLEPSTLCTAAPPPPRAAAAPPRFTG